MRLVAVPAALSLILALQASVAQAADDIIVNGLHCNNLCQSWLGVGGKSGGKPTDAAPFKERQQVSIPLAVPPVQARRSGTVVVASLSAPSPRDAMADVEPSPAPSLASTATHSPYRTAVRAPASTIRPRGVLTASREVAPAAVRAPLPHLAPEPSVHIVPLVSAPPAMTRVEPTPVIPAPVSKQDAVDRSSPAFQPSQQRGRVASYEVGEPLLAPDGARSVPQPKAFRGPVTTRSRSRMEPGLTTLPRLDDVVAVHGTIMIETAEDKALAKRQLDDLIKATTRPKQFKTGFIGQPSTEENASKVVTGNAD